MSLLVSAGVAVLTFGALDAVWLTLASKRLYRPQLGSLLLDRVKFPPALLFYVIYGAALAYLAVQPAVAGGAPVVALQNGGVFGLAAYATYNLTNLATLRGWSLAVTVADLVWGTLASASAAFGAAMIVRALRLA